MAELWDVYDAQMNPTGQTLVRGEPVPPGLHHLVVGILVRHRDGSTLVMQRDWAKKELPGKWEAGASGAVLQGETALQGALRELREETGLTAERLTPLFTAKGTGRSSHVFYAAYVCHTDAPKESVRLQAGETIAYQWLEQEAFDAFRRTPDFVCAHREQWERYFTAYDERIRT